jgi:hypothetical protein
LLEAAINVKPGVTALNVAMLSAGAPRPFVLKQKAGVDMFSAIQRALLENTSCNGS